MRHTTGLAVAAWLAGTAGTAGAQPFNVRSWYARGQVFVVWQMTAPPAAPTDTVEVYASAAAQVNVANMTRVGRMFFPEYTGARLQELQGGARLLVPTPAGGTYRLAADEGVFVYTPHQAGNLFFAVVDTGAAVVNAGNSASAAFGYDPVNDPVRPHPQFAGTTPGGNPYTALVVWADGNDDPSQERPDVPVFGDADKNGVPHVFTITMPTQPMPPGAASCLFALHGGGGEYQLFRPGIAARANLSLGLTDGIVVTPDDSYFARQGALLDRTNTSWFGYTPWADPFDAAFPRSAPPNGEVVNNYTQRRVFWILDWLLSARSPVVVDPRRVAMVGHSGGGRGTSHLTRLHPERFCAAVCYTPASDLSIPPSGNQDNFLRGDWTQNLTTNVIGPDGVPLGSTDVFTVTTRLSPTHRDFAYTRFYYGKRDEEGPASWTPAQRAVCDALNATDMGIIVSWDEREHGVEKWDNETSDAADGHAGPWPDVGQWIAPVRTRRPSGQYLVNTYRSDQSYPGFFNVDADANAAGRQPDPGPGDPDLGDAWGTWGGYLDWDTATIVDEPGRWECTVFASALQPASIDNAPANSYLADIAPRKTLSFVPGTGATVYWYVLSSAGVPTQQGVASAEAEGVVKVPGVVVPREDAGRVRLVLSLTALCGGDLNQDGNVDQGDVELIADVVAGGANPGGIDADFNHDGNLDQGDVDALITVVAGGACP